MKLINKARSLLDTGHEDNAKLTRLQDQLPLANHTELSKISEELEDDVTVVERDIEFPGAAEYDNRTINTSEICFKVTHLKRATQNDPRVPAIYQVVAFRQESVETGGFRLPQLDIPVMGGP